MKRFLKYLLLLSFIPFLSFTSLSLLFSSEKSITWLFESVSEQLGYQSKFFVSDLDWSFTNSRFSLSELSIQEEDKGHSFYSDTAVASIDLFSLVSYIDIYPFNLIQRENLLLVELDKATLHLKNYDLNEINPRTKFTSFILKNSLLRLDELNFQGSIEEVDISRYVDLFTNDLGNKNLPKISFTNALISKIKLGPLELLDTSLSLSSSTIGLEFLVANPDIEGKILVKQNIKEGIGVDLSKLQLSLNNSNSSNIFEYLLDNLTIPISLSVEKLFLDNRDFGQLSLLVTKEDKKLKFSELEYQGLGLELGKNFDNKAIKRNLFSVSRKDRSIYSSFQGKVLIDNLSQSLLSLKGTSKDLNFVAGASNINLDISWKGLPNQFNVNNVEGNLFFRIDDFIIKDIDSDILGSSDFLKLVSIFNVGNTLGDLTNLNFKEKFNSGFQADRAEGSLVIERDFIKTSNAIVFKGSSGEFKWDGSMQKTNEGNLENIDFDIIVTLPLREYLPAYALILGGPITAATVYIAGKAFKKPLNKLSSGKWRVSGSIQDPNTEFIEWFE